MTAGFFASAVPAMAEELNLYSSRHYKTDEALYDNFTEQTGIKINRIEGKGDALIERIIAEGDNSPADVFLTVDAARLYRADQAGLFQPLESAVLDEKIPAALRHPDGHWYGFSTRARLIYFNKDKVQEGELAAYEDLADPKWAGRVCIRSSSNVYNQSLLGSIIAAKGEGPAKDWAGAVKDNFARDPAGGDTDQIRAVAAGECDVAVANSYYFVRLMTSDKDEDKAVAEKVGWVFPNQSDRGTHVNVSGGGVLKNAPNRDAAVKFLEYLASADAQRYFADGNNEYPAVSDVPANSPLATLGEFKADDVNLAVIGENQPTAQKVFDQVGWQ
ncbi:MAG: Fe(3+) ABC transporter substrate-binding protein [Pseudomonadota bacterium]